MCKKGHTTCTDGCEIVVCRTYQELRAHGVDDLAAFSSALNVYRLRHPSQSRAEAIYWVSEWLSTDGEMVN